MLHPICPESRTPFGPGQRERLKIGGISKKQENIQVRLLVGPGICVCIVINNEAASVATHTQGGGGVGGFCGFKNKK